MMNWTKVIQEIEQYIGRPINVEFRYCTVYSDVSVSEIDIQSDIGQNLIMEGWILSPNQCWCKVLNGA
jgi:hypothetical protein